MALPCGRRIAGRTIAVGVAVVAADLLFFDVGGVGVSAAAFASLLLVLLRWTHGGGPLRRDGHMPVWLGVAAVLPLVAEPTRLAILLASLGLTTAALTARQGWTPAVGAWVGRWLGFALAGFFRLPRDVVRIAARPGGGGTRHRAGFGRRWGIPVLLSAVFVVLFAVANPVVAGWLEDAGAWIVEVVEEIDILRIGLWLTTALLVWPFLRARVRRSRIAFVTYEPEPPRGVPVWLTRALLLFNAVFLVQNALDVRYLWLGAALPEGMTYAQYAHRGAYPLVATALLAAGFVLLTFRPGADRAAFRWPRRLVTAWLLQNVFLTVCAVQRLALYVGAYDLTRLRVAAGLWMGLVALGLALVLWRILRDRSNAWLVRRNVLAAVGVLYLASVLPVDRFVADWNVANAPELGGHGGALDVRYLRRLGADALPAWERLARESQDAALRDVAARQAAALRARLEEELADWRTWTVRRRALAR